MTKAAPLILLAGIATGCRVAPKEHHALTVTLVPLGRASSAEVEAVRTALRKAYNFEIKVGARRPLPKAIYYPPGHRYRADHLISWLSKDAPSDKVLGIARVDISTTARGHKDWGVVGLAKLGGISGAVSSYRLRGDLNCLGDVAVHEIAHTLGRPHCATKGCTMHDKEGRVAIGRTRTLLCPQCRKALTPWLR